MARTVKFKLDDTPGHLLRRASQYAYDLFTTEVGAGGLTPRQFTVLVAVSQNEGLTQTDLVTLTGIDRSTLADMISRMMSSGLLTRQRTKDDARANSVTLSAKGRAALSRATSKADAAEKKILSAVPAAHRKSFMAALRAIAAKTSEEGGSRPAKKATKKKAAKRATSPKGAKTAKKKSAKRKTAKRTAKRSSSKAAKSKR